MRRNFLLIQKNNGHRHLVGRYCSNAVFEGSGVSGRNSSRFGMHMFNTFTMVSKLFFANILHLLATHTFSISHSTVHGTLSIGSWRFFHQSIADFGRTMSNRWDFGVPNRQSHMLHSHPISVDRIWKKTRKMMKNENILEHPPFYLIQLYIYNIMYIYI